jgi:N-methylhydantoinase A
MSDLWRRFHQEHQSRFGFCIPGETIEMVHLKVVGVYLLKKPQVKPLREQSGTPQSTGKRQVRFEPGWVEVPVYARDSFGQGCRITGPAIIEEISSATVLCADQNLVVDAFGNLLISA